jgi:hypothetical protein
LPCAGEQIEYGGFSVIWINKKSNVFHL